MKRITGCSILIALTTLILTGCGGSGGGSAPTPPAPTLTSIAVTPVDPTTALNARVQLTATGTYSNGATSNITSAVTWSSASTAVATVTSNSGMLSPVATATPGQTSVITATIGALTATTTVTLSAKPTFTLAGGGDPLTPQQWGLRNTAQNGYADTVGVASTGTNGTDANVDSVYSTGGHTGYGVIVGVIDTGLEIAHEDISVNVVPGGSWNFATSTTDPTNTVSTTGDHGTMVSGLIAMARNGKGGVGVASNAQLKGFNWLAPNVTQYYDSVIAALGGSSANPKSNDVSIFNQSYGSTQNTDTLIYNLLEAQYAAGVTTLRGGKGALYVKSAGNGFIDFGSASCTGAASAGVSCQNPNFDPDDTLPYNIVVAALNAKGLRSYYSSAGSAVWVSTPGGEYGYNTAVTSGLISVAYDPAMVTTDQSGCVKGHSRTGASTSLFDLNDASLAGINAGCNYTNSMNGTSSAAPMLSGVIALMLEANPALTWRDVKHILASTSDQVDAAIAPVTTSLTTGGAYTLVQGWTTNAAGYNFHNWYGFGAANASAAVSMATVACAAGCGLGTFANTGWVTGTVPANPANIVPDDSTAGVTVPVTVGAGAIAGNIVETVQLKVTTTSSTGGTSSTICVSGSIGCTGDITIELTSPSGTKSILKTTYDGFASEFFNGMVLASNAFYGEPSNGVWNAKLVDGWTTSANQTVTAVQLRVYGH